jgi:hypothetical protein
MATEETNSAKIHTSRTLGPPRQVVADPALSKDEKTEALEALVPSTASEEGMTGGEKTNLHDVLNAQEVLKGRTAAPTPGSDAEVAKEVEIEKLDP